MNRLKKGKKKVRVAKGLSKTGLLKLINPKQRPYIELEDMVIFIQKSILKRLPLKEKITCKKIFYNYIFTYKNFNLPVEIFI